MENIGNDRMENAGNDRIEIVGNDGMENVGNDRIPKSCAVFDTSRCAKIRKRGRH